ncbi:MAG TPA: hypothetical protein VJR05_04385 [Acidimicrobiia bacterium]|nr:hypothetical protein [Acidimicrobiia bacterium]
MDEPCPETGGDDYRFAVRLVVIEPGQSRPFSETEWRDALVIVDRGEIELECLHGSRRRFGRGSLVWLVGLDLKIIHNPGPVAAALMAVSRRGRAEPIPTDLGYAPEPRS